MKALRREAALYADNPRSTWDMTGYELDELIDAGRRRKAEAAAENELLAFNIGALVLAAFNAPQRFPKTPGAAFGRKPPAPADGGKSDFMRIAEQLNGRLAHKTGETL